MVTKYKFTSIFLMLLFFSCNEKKENISISEYPKHIKTKMQKQQYDDAKWEIYKLNVTGSNNCAKSNLADESGVQRQPKKLHKLTTLEMELFEDTLLNGRHEYTFFLRDNLVAYNIETKRHFHDCTIFFKNDTIVAVSGGRVTFEYRHSPSIDSQFATILLQNTADMNPWLKKEAIKRGILKEY